MGWGRTSGLFYKHMTIINENSRVVNKLEASITDNPRVIIYNRHRFIIQAIVHQRHINQPLRLSDMTILS